MKDTTHSIDGTNIAVHTEQVTTCPLAFIIKATHPDGATHEASLKIGDSELKNVPTLPQAQSDLNAAREAVAQMCHKKAVLANIAASLE